MSLKHTYIYNTHICPPPPPPPLKVDRRRKYLVALSCGEEWLFWSLLRQTCFRDEWLGNVFFMNMCWNMKYHIICDINLICISYEYGLILASRQHRIGCNVEGGSRHCTFEVKTNRRSCPPIHICIFLYMEILRSTYGIYWMHNTLTQAWTSALKSHMTQHQQEYAIEKLERDNRRLREELRASQSDCATEVKQIFLIAACVLSTNANEETKSTIEHVIHDD